VKRRISGLLLFSSLMVFALGAWAAAQEPAAAPPAGLKSTDPKERAKAAKELGKKGTPSDVPALAALINDPEADVRREVVGALASIHAPESLDPIIAATHDADLKIRNLAIESLVNYYVGKSQTPGFAGLWKNTWDKAKGHFTQDDLKIDPGIQVEPKVIKALVEALNNADAIEPSRRAARGLGVLLAREAVPDLVKGAHSMDDERALECLNSLLKIKEPAAGPQLVDLLDSPREEVKLQAAVTVGLLKVQEAVPKLQTLYENGANKPVQEKSLQGLAYIGSPVSVPIFTKALWSNDKTIRALAAEGLGRAGDAKAMEELQKAVNGEKSAEPRFAMMFAITALGEMTYLSDLVTGLGSTFRGDVVRSYLIELSRKPDILKRLYPFTTHRDAGVRRQLCTVFMYSGDASSIEPLEKLSQDSKGDVATEALRALRVVRMRVALAPPATSTAPAAPPAGNTP
jgi:HEAT repeat protein